MVSVILTPVVIPAKARLQDVGGRAASGTGRRGIHPRQPCLQQAGGIMTSPSHCHSRSRGNVLHRPLDSSFRWNDGGGYGCSPATFNEIFRPLLAQWVRMTEKHNNTPSSFRRRPESTRVSPCLQQAGGIITSPSHCHSRSRGNVLHKPLDSSFCWNDGGGYGCSPATFNIIFVPYVIHISHSRSRGNVLHKPLDSSFRWNDDGGYGCSPATFNEIFRPLDEKAEQHPIVIYGQDVLYAA